VGEQLTDAFVEEAMPGMGSVENLRAELLRTTTAKREDEQKELVHEALIAAVAERIEADIPDSAIRQLAQNEYQAKLHEMQLKVSAGEPFV
jgi:FKBP-type peptidyl-prolyl cis-trans isomerase (trigger factor)